MKTDDDLRAELDGETGHVETVRPKRPLTAIRLADFLAIEIPARGHVLEPVIPEQGLAMIVAKRGVGKTHVGLTLAYAIATGGNVFDWKAPKPRSVVYLDGEMPARTMQDRLANILRASNASVPVDFRIITPDLVDDVLPNLADPAGQAAINEVIASSEVVLVDNLSAWCRSGGENEADRWQVMQDWLLFLRRIGKTIILIHHAGKDGSQRGTSRREDVLDTSIELRHPHDFSPSQGARFEVHVTKCRNEFGGRLDPFEAQLLARPDGGTEWVIKPVEDARLIAVVELSADGLSVRQIADEMGISTGLVAKLQKKARGEGRLPTQESENRKSSLH
ncbi:MAG: AAA family ATPase [Geminicoccaceae bacterium]|nr:AAA family ATPase [Geminicoccaceae bacterium]